MKRWWGIAWAFLTLVSVGLMAYAINWYVGFDTEIPRAHHKWTIRERLKLDRPEKP